MNGYHELLVAAATVVAYHGKSSDSYCSAAEKMAHHILAMYDHTPCTIGWFMEIGGERFGMNSWRINSSKGSEHWSLELQRGPNMLQLWTGRKWIDRPTKGIVRRLLEVLGEED